MKIGLMAAACAALLTLSACGSGDTGGTPGAESSVVGPGSGDQGDGGQDGPDTPVDGGSDQASVDLPGLPIGGGASFEDSTSACATIAWNNENTLDGVVVTITDLTYPDGVSLDTSVSCDGPPCLGADSFTADQLSCTVGLTWDGTPPTTDPEQIVANGTATCDSQDLCDQLEAASSSFANSSSIQFPAGDESS
jgi:hypothetical protein